MLIWAKIGCKEDMKNVDRVWGRILIFVLCIVHLLLPIERGFPVIRIGGYPITLSMLVSIVIFAFLFVRSGGYIVWALPKVYVPYQIIVVWIFLISALISTDVEAGLFVVLLYFITFVVDFLIIRYLFQKGFRREFSVILCIVASVAALVGIIEGVFHYYLPFYRQAFLNYNYESISYAMIRSDFRALGTLGNPLIYSVALLLVVPFAMEIKSSLKKYLVVMLLILAFFFAVSTTALVMGVILFVGYYILSPHKLRFVQVGLLAALAVMLWMLFISPSSDGGESSIFSSWAAEFAFGEYENPQIRNIQIRRYLATRSLEIFWSDKSFTSVLFGHGLKSSIEAVSVLQLGSFNTFDNIYATLLFESGILGLGAYLLMGLNTLTSFRQRAKDNLHWYSVLGLFVAGISFTTIYYNTFNFVWVASVAALLFDGSQWQGVTK